LRHAEVTMSIAAPRSADCGAWRDLFNHRYGVKRPHHSRAILPMARTSRANYRPGS